MGGGGGGCVRACVRACVSVCCIVVVHVCVCVCVCVTELEFILWCACAYNTPLSSMQSRAAS